VDGQGIEDALDAAYAIAEETFALAFYRGGNLRRTRVERLPGQDWGAAFEPPQVRHCGNRCVFCFVDQMPRGLRSSLYVKDEDYRHSFLYGNYVTLSNVSERDLARIRRLKLSPLYISVHATLEQVRRTLLGRKRTPPILPLLKKMAAAGIELHTQAVICPGINDGKVMERTVADLSRLAPRVRSLALVPVGLSAHRRGLAELRGVDARLTQALLAKVAAWQKRFFKQRGTRFVFATDEWYLRAGRAVPPASAYEGFPQLENGVGIVRQFLDGVRAASRALPARVAPRRRVLIPVGTLAERTVRRALAPLSRVRGLELEVVPVPNRLFGERVTVTGLLGGNDLLGALRPRMAQKTRVLIAGDMLRDGHDVFLDGVTLKQFRARLGVPVQVIRSPAELVRAAVGKI
jgi:putative radical SAM enzyme (TIGR03279 family)